MKKHLIAGSGLADAANRISAAWNAAKSGGAVEVQDTVSFVSWAALSSVLTDRRYELLQHLHAQPADSIRALARSLNRDFRRVHEDVTLLKSAGLIDDSSGQLRADYSEIQTTILMKPAA